MSYISYEDMSDHEGCTLLPWSDTQVQAHHQLPSQQTFDCGYLSDDASPISIPSSDSDATEAELTIEEDAAQRAWCFYRRVARRHNLVSPSPDDEKFLESYMSSYLEHADESSSKHDLLAAAAQEDLVFELEM